MAISLDGRIADHRNPGKPLGTPWDRRMMNAIRQKADAVLMGAETLRIHRRPIKALNTSGRRLVNVILTRSGELDPNLPFWKDPEVLRFIFVCKPNYAKALRSSRDRAFVVPAGKRQIDLKTVIQTLSRAGLTQILVEGGGETIRSFVAADLLDEFYLTLTPWLIGGAENPSLVGGDFLARWHHWNLQSAKKVKNEIYLHYKR